VFVTKLPKQLPGGVLGPVNNWILQNLMDTGVGNKYLARRVVTTVDQLRMVRSSRAVVFVGLLRRPEGIGSTPAVVALPSSDTKSILRATQKSKQKQRHKTVD
jgi:hypothetical protein